jgi:hypothetical protein
MLVESPLTLSEITQNSLMVSEPGHPFLKSVLDLIASIVSDVRDKHSVKYPFTKLYENVFFGRLLHTLSTLFMTGPATLDKALVQAYLKHEGNLERKPKRNPAHRVRLLDHKLFYEGTVAKHHQNNSWFDGYKVLKLFIVVIALIMLGVILVCVLTTFFSTKAVYRKKYQRLYL